MTASTTAAAGNGARALAGQVSAALTAGSALLAICMAVSLALIVPAEISARRGRRNALAAAPHTTRAY